MKCLTRGAGVMPLEALVNVAGYADIVTIGVALAAKNVNESLSDAAHTGASHVSRHPESGMILRGRSCRAADAGSLQVLRQRKGLQKVKTAVRLRPLRGFGETPSHVV